MREREKGRERERGRESALYSGQMSSWSPSHLTVKWEVYLNGSRTEAVTLDLLLPSSMLPSSLSLSLSLLLAFIAGQCWPQMALGFDAVSSVMMLLHCSARTAASVYGSTRNVPDGGTLSLSLRLSLFGAHSQVGDISCLPFSSCTKGNRRRFAFVFAFCCCCRFIFNAFKKYLQL